MNAQAHRLYTGARIGSQVTRFPERRTSSFRGIGTLAAVSGGLFEGRARSPRAVVERLSRRSANLDLATAA